MSGVISDIAEGGLVTVIIDSMNDIGLDVDVNRANIEKKAKNITSQCEFIPKKGKHKGARCSRNGRIRAIVNGAEMTVCSQHNPAYLTKQTENRRARLARRRNEARAANVGAALDMAGASDSDDSE